MYFVIPSLILESICRANKCLSCSPITFGNIRVRVSWFFACLLSYTRLEVRERIIYYMGGIFAVENFVYSANLLFTNSFRQLDVSELPNFTRTSPQFRGT